MALIITDNNFDELVLKSEKPIIVDFWAEWCGPCRAIAPYVEQISDEYAGRALVGKADVEQCPESAEKYAIRNIPALLFFKNGELVDKHVGLTSKAILTDKLNALL